MRALLSALISVCTLALLSACASSKPKGQIVRLQMTDDSQAPEQEKQAEPELHKLAQTPDVKEDAAVYYFSLGQAYSLDNEVQKAIEAYRAALVHDPNSALIHSRLAAELVKTGNYAEAKLLCEKAIVLDGKYIDSYLLLAGIQVAAKEFEAALKTYRDSLVQDANNRDALLYYGVTLAEVGRVAEGIKQLQRLVKMKDTDESSIDQSVAHYYLAKIYLQSNQRNEAVASLRQALKKRPGFSKAALVLGDLLFKQGDERSAVQVLEEAFRESRKGDLAERLAGFYLEKGNYKGAIVYLETLVEEDPTNENMKLRLALVYWQVKWYEKAKKLLVDLHDRYQASSEIAFYLGELHMDLNQPDEAFYFYKKISPDYPKFDVVVGRVTQAFRQQKKFVAAETYIQEVLTKRSDMVALYPLLGAVYEDQGKVEEAKHALERGYRLFAQDESILYYLGFLYDRLGDRDEGMKKMEELLKVNPSNSNALNFVGYTLLEHVGDIAAAANYLERAFALKPDDAYVLDSYGWLLYRQGKRQEAMKKLEKAHGLRPDEGVIAEHLADIYVALDMPMKALAIYEKALGAQGVNKEFFSRVNVKMENLRNAMSVTPAKKVVGRSRKARMPASRTETP